MRPLRFRDGTPHPCAKVPTMRFSVTSESFYMMQAQVLGDYLLLWFGSGDETDEHHSVRKLYLIAWKQGSITLVSSFLLSMISSIGGINCGDDDDDDSSGKILQGSMELSLL